MRPTRSACALVSARRQTRIGLNPHDGGKCNYGDPAVANHPMNCVNWGQAAVYCQAHGKRLPTEQEWEFAARGGAEERPWPWGSEAPGAQLCWQGVSKQTMALARSLASAAGAYGLEDMVGNVWAVDRRSTMPPDYAQLPDHAARAGSGVVAGAASTRRAFAALAATERPHRPASAS